MTLKGLTVLVTGGGGFLGSAVIRKLIDRGCRIRSLCRSHYSSLSTLGVQQIPGDIRNPDSVEKACRGVDLVIHTAAKAGVWGKAREFHDINVTGTRNVLVTCKHFGGIPLVHTSSPSVVFSGRDMAGVNETVPYPTRHSTHYPATKAQAEQLVLQSTSEGLPAIILRPHLIWGPGDNHLVPRIVQRAHQLRRIGNGRNLVDTTYIDNAAEAHVLASEQLLSNPHLSGRIYFISQGEPVPLWDMVDQILTAAGKEPVRGRIPKRAAWFIGALLEFIYTLFRLPGEPRMTRFLAEELSTSHWFDIQSARRDLNYSPVISTRQGLALLAEWFQEPSNCQ